MAKILVAGAGHGGLVAAYNLAKEGYDVTVIEAKQRSEMGHDWEDFLNMTAFDLSGIPRPDESMYTQENGQGFRNPSGTKMIRVATGSDSMTMDRKLLLSHIIDCALEAGVKIIFGHKIISPIVYNATVKGFNVCDGERNYRLTGDLVIDSAGMYSPIRTQLPVVCGIQKDFQPKDVFHIYRAYYENPSCRKTEPQYIVDLFHMNRPGIDWTITHENHIDILIGKFGSSGELSQSEVDETLSAYKKEYPFFTDNILRGGYFADIPLSKMLPMLVCDGYAAIGDCAGMTVPLNGSGMVLSMRAGKILADTIIKADGKYTREKLWPYQYNYFCTMGHSLVIVAVLKSFFTHISGEVVDLFIEKEILNSQTLNIGGDEPLDISSEFVANALGIMPSLYRLFPSMIRSFKGLPVLFLLDKIMPEEYSEDGIRKWQRVYGMFG